jgi:hypothetical protein
MEPNCREDAVERELDYTVYNSNMTFKWLTIVFNYVFIHQLSTNIHKFVSELVGLVV